MVCYASGKSVSSSSSSSSIRGGSSIISAASNIMKNVASTISNSTTSSNSTSGSRGGSSSSSSNRGQSSSYSSSSSSSGSISSLFNSAANTIRNATVVAGSTVGGSVSYSCGGGSSSSYGTSSNSTQTVSKTVTSRTVTSKTPTTSGAQTLTGVSQIGGQNSTKDKLLNNYVSDDKLVFKKDGTIYAGDQQIYLKQQNGKYYITDKNGNYMRNSDGRVRVLNTSNYSAEAAQKIDNYYNYGSTYGNSGSISPSTNINTNPSNNQSNNKVFKDGTMKYGQDGKVKIDGEQVYFKKEDGKYYLTDENGNYIYSSNGNRRVVNPASVSSEMASKIENYYNYGSIYGENGGNKNSSSSVSKVINDNAMSYAADGSIKLGDQQVYFKQEGNKYYLTDENGNYIYTSNGGKRYVGGGVSPDSMVEKVDNYNKYGYTFGDARQIDAQLSAQGLDFGSVSQNIQKIEGTTITLTNGKKIDTSSMDANQIYNAVRSNGLTINEGYAGNSGVVDISTIRPGNKTIDQLRQELSLYDGVGGNSYIDNKFAPYDKNLTAHQTYVLNTFDSYCDQVGLTEQQKKDWAYIVGRESGFNTGAVNGSCTGLGQLQPYNINSYASDPSKYRSGDAATQIDATYKYIIDRYGSVEAARAFWDRNNYY